MVRKSEPDGAGDLCLPTEVAAELRVTRQTVYNWAKAGGIACVTLPGGHLRVPRSEVARIKGAVPTVVPRETPAERAQRAAAAVAAIKAAK